MVAPKITAAEPAWFGKLPPKEIWAPAGLALLALLAYSIALGYPFIYDDLGQIVKNPSVQSWHYLPSYFTSDFWSYYRPVFLTWLLLNFKLFALETAGWHATSLLLHAATTVLVYFLARRDLKDQAAAVFCATIFAVHPIHVESVTWISGVTEPLMAVPLLGCILCFRRWQDGNDRRWYAASLLLCALALLAKDTAIIIVPILFFYEWLRPREAVPSQRLCAVALAVAPFAALTVVYVVVRAWVLRGFVPGMVEEHATKMQVLLTLPSALWFYFCKLVWPSSLSVYYPFGFVIKPGFANFVLPTLALIAIFVGLWMWSRRQPEAVPACVWLLLPLVPPLIGLGRAVPIMVHDRYLYLPSIGFACCLRWRCGAFDLVSTPWLASR